MYIDDLLTFNNPSFEEHIPMIYPPKLTLKKTTEATTMLSYLDICIKIKDRKFTTSVYDKRDYFTFHVVKFSHMDSNIPCRPAYSVYISQLVRISDNFDDFNTRHMELTTRLQKQGYKYDRLCYTFKTFWKKYEDLMKKFDVSVHDHIQHGISLPLNCIKQSNKIYKQKID